MDFPTQVSRSGGRPSMDQVLQSGGKITEYHKHANDDYYVVHVTTPQREIFNFSNVRPDHLEKYLKSAQPPSYRGKEEAHRPTHVTLEELMDRGGKIVSFHPTRAGYFSVNVKVPESDGTTNVYVFTNISRDKFERYRSRESVYHGPQEFHPPATEKYPSPQTSPGKDQSQEMMRRRFEESMRNGGEIVGKEQFRTFSVHVRY
ncbi:hypothetical protein BKA69DRAFT_1037281 [Paraphysoderma sedebokerense]|nr:hypothetical protein BKA69DRAFT_1037281 [Paraphysoderma sedebokerense]